MENNKLSWDEIEILRMGCNHEGYYELVEFCKEVALSPYPDSDLKSLWETLQTRAKDILKRNNL